MTAQSIDEYKKEILDKLVHDTHSGQIEWKMIKFNLAKATSDDVDFYIIYVAGSMSLQGGLVGAEFCVCKTNKTKLIPVLRTFTGEYADFALEVKRITESMENDKEIKNIYDNYVK